MANLYITALAWLCAWIFDYFCGLPACSILRTLAHIQGSKVSQLHVSSAVCEGDQ